MIIGLIDADLLDGGTRHPNLALLKMSGFLKSRGHNIYLVEDYDQVKKFDKVYLARVFSFTKIPDGIIDQSHVVYGGTGFEDEPILMELPHEVEHYFPDYSLYDKFIAKEIERGIKPIKFKDYQDYSIGFMTRGCFRKCEFCVNKKYDKAFLHSPLKEFLDPQKKYIYLWDDNVFACADWRKVFEELDASGKAYQFRQGLDIRLLSEEKAEVLAKAKYHGDIIFAFDNIKDRELIENKLALWCKYSENKSTKLYVLCAHESQDERDIETVFERIKILIKYKCLPYIMRFKDYEESEYKGIYITLARWCNQPSIFKKKSFREFCLLRKDSERYMQEFEAKHPEIAQKYFNMKFEGGSGDGKDSN